MENWRGKSKKIIIENFEVYGKDDDMGKTAAHYISQLTNDLRRDHKREDRFRVEIEITVYAK